jgi:hypothetical protein
MLKYMIRKETILLILVLNDKQVNEKLTLMGIDTLCTECIYTINYIG